MNNRIFGLLSYIFLFSITLIPNVYAADDLLSVDPKQLLIQLVIFIIALFILNTLIFKPLVRVWERRDELTKGTVDEARNLTDEVEEIISNYNSKINEARTEATEIRNELRRQGQSEAEKILTSTREETQKELDSHRGKLEIEITEIKNKIQPEIDLLSKDISTRILGKGV